LFVGCNSSHISDFAIPGFRHTSWREYRIDTDVAVHPDWVGEASNLGQVSAEFADAIFIFRNLEALPRKDVAMALVEFLRVLRKDGFAVICCADVEAIVGTMVSAGASIQSEDLLSRRATLMELLSFDAVNSWRGPSALSHRCGFAFDYLVKILRDAGFASVAGFRRPSGFDIWLLASKCHRSEVILRGLAQNYLVELG
jgi:hypothetical protein